MAREFAKAFYSSKTWQDCRNRYIKDKHYFCENCMRRGIYTPAVYVHHIIELDPVNISNPEITLNPDNLEAVCRECHADYHDKRKRGRRYRVGPNGEVIINGEA